MNMPCMQHYGIKIPPVGKGGGVRPKQQLCQKIVPVPQRCYPLSSIFGRNSTWNRNLMKSFLAARVLFFLASLTFMLSGCVTTDYVGKSYAQTTEVDLFFSESDITRPHEIMGSIRAEGPDLMSFEDMEQELVKQAMLKGADAVLIVDMGKISVGSFTNSSGQGSGDPEYYLDDDLNLKKRGGSNEWSSSTYTTETIDKVLTAKLIKYTKTDDD